MRMIIRPVLDKMKRSTLLLAIGLLFRPVRICLATGLHGERVGIETTACRASAEKLARAADDEHLHRLVLRGAVAVQPQGGGQLGCRSRFGGTPAKNEDGRNEEEGEERHDLLLWELVLWRLVLWMLLWRM